MTTSSYMPNDDGGKADLLDHLAATLPKYAALLEISDADIAILQADAASFRYALHTMNEMQLFSCRHAARGEKNETGDCLNDKARPSFATGSQTPTASSLLGNSKAVNEKSRGVP